VVVVDGATYQQKGGISPPTFDELPHAAAADLASPDDDDDDKGHDVDLPPPAPISVSVSSLSTPVTTTTAPAESAWRCRCAARLAFFLFAKFDTAGE
jgi:hypothetical protein